MSLNDREFATLFWLAVLLLFCLFNQNTRSSLVSLVVMFFTEKIFIPFLMLFLYSICIILAGYRLGIWDTSLVTETAIWFITVASVTLLNLSNIIRDYKFVRTTALRVLGFTVIIQFIANLYPFNFMVEVLLQAVVTVLLVLHVYSSKKDDKTYKNLANLTASFVITIGLFLFMWALLQVMWSWSTINWPQTVKEFSVPVWLTILLLPFIYVLALLSAYELAFIKMKISVPAGTNIWRGRAALIWKAHFRLRRVTVVTQRTLRAMAIAPTFQIASSAYSNLIVENTNSYTGEQSDY